ncbi:MAG TPA: nucleoside-diphosphate kinase [Deltaproteobacteria bacterium]|nr:MAG: nucleoside-diphosphate kinase [Deltaproteobacteria bacterium GWA2_45_12]HBF13566.1 nucleoside-diphosphate kinase [Deltaproteobacteria bacterium]
MTEKTLGIIKPDGVARNLIGQILSRVEKAGLKIVAIKKLQLNTAKAEGFYAVHKERPFFKDLVKYMTSGPVVPFVMEGEGAIAKWRELMGATNPEKAAPGTIRKDFAENIERNTVHGSDAPETAQFEVGYFFESKEIC